MTAHDDIVRALVALAPGAVWTMHGENPAMLIWQDSIILQPTQAQITAWVAANPGPSKPVSPVLGVPVPIISTALII
jgi:hypothetical protein